MTTAALFIAGLAIGVLTWASLLALTHLLIVRATRKAMRAPRSSTGASVAM